MAKDKSDLEFLKDQYAIFQKKYGLPDFMEMNQDFYIEKIEIDKTEMLLREIRRMVGDRMANYMRFVENLLNPVNVPMFVFSIVKMLNQEDKKQLSETYKKLIKNEIKFLERDLVFDEKKEAEFIKESFNLWQEIKKELAPIFAKFEEKKEKLEENNRGYFG